VTVAIARLLESGRERSTSVLRRDAGRVVEREDEQLGRRIGAAAGRSHEDERRDEREEQAHLRRVAARGALV
jgi:hypothetical protein